LISGANRGIGLEFARQYLADKWQVYASCRDPSSASELRRMADGSGGKLQVLSMDVGDLASVKAAALELQGKPIDLILNNAGIGGPRGQTIGNIDYETWRHVRLPAAWDQLAITPPEEHSPIAARRLP
jgi:NAD(P)-dependent dehydrogenase (short-subunit alcohol dehydrogenase family)